jgi:hypothetical protein
MAYRLLNGDTLMRKCLDDAQRALGVLRTVLGAASEAETARVGVAGHSFGGTLAMYHAAVDERCQFACVSGATCSYANRQARGTGLGMMEVVPGLAKRLEASDVIAAIQPRPLLVVSSTEDDYAADTNQVLLAAGAFSIGGIVGALQDGGVEGMIGVLFFIIPTVLLVLLLIWLIQAARNSGQIAAAQSQYQAQYWQYEQQRQAYSQHYPPPNQPPAPPSGPQAG